MITRRDLLKKSALVASATALLPQLLNAQSGGGIIKRAIPKTGEQLPIIGLGSSANFSSLANSADATALREVLRALIDNGGTVFDTAPGYGGGTSEEVAGDFVNELGVADDIFWATKLNVVARRSNNLNADPVAARAQLERSFEIIKNPVIDLIQVHNLGDIPVQLGMLKEAKEDGRIRYLGTTWTGEQRFEDLAEVMRNEPLDFVGIDYAIDNRVAAERMLPMAQELGIATLIYLPFGRDRLWSRVSGQELPDWAAEIDAHSWAQFFLKYIAANPAVTAITPSTSKPANMIDNLSGGIGQLPDADMLRRMERHVDSLPQA
jgi:aryl-alcohol dehydrogenase-like predicted oxidoreductase|tara:strand:+ start:175323 stop:176285 length:963 start_codon:yes stop_codon:yes gene_type:complete